MSHRICRALCGLVVAACLMQVTDASAKSRRRARKGILQLISSLDGAEVFLDGRSMGKTPLKPLAVKSGKHQLEVLHLGHLPFKQEVSIIWGRTRQIVADLIPVAGVLQAEVLPPETEIWVDDTLLGRGVIEAEVPIGRREVRFVGRGLKTVKRPTLFTAGAVAALSVVMEPAQLELEPLSTNASDSVRVTRSIASADEGGAFYESWWFWTFVGVVAAGTSVAIATSGGGDAPPDNPYDNRWLLGQRFE